MNARIEAAARRVAASEENGRKPSPATLKIAAFIKRRYRTRNFPAMDGAIHVLFDHVNLPDHLTFKAFLDQLGFTSQVGGKPNDYHGGSVVYGESSGESWIHVAFAPDTASALVSDITPPDKQ